MKKTICVILAVILSCSVMFTFNASAYTTKTDALFDKINNATEISVRFSTGSTTMGSSYSTYAIKGNAMAYDFYNGYINMRVVLVDGVAYGYLPIFPFLYIKVSDTGLNNMNIKSLIKTATGLTKGITHFEESYQETLNGINYYVEQFNDGATVKLKYYYLGDDLKVLNVRDYSTQSVQNTYFDDISFSVPNSMFTIPTGLDITPLAGSIFTTLISSNLI